GKPEEGLTEIDRRLFEKPGVPRPAMLPLLVERARLLVALGRKKEAEQELETFLAKFPSGGDLRPVCDACLQLGLLRQDRGDAAGAKAAFQRAYQQKLGEEPIAGMGGGLGLVHHIIAGALSNQLTDDQAQAILDALHDTFTRDGKNPVLKTIPRPPAALLRECWLGSRGRDCARKIAFQSVSFREVTLIPGKLLLSEWVAHSAFARKLTAEEDALLWKLIEDAVTGLPTGQLQQTPLLQIGWN